MAKGLKLPKNKMTREQFRESARAATGEVKQLRAAAQIANDSLKAGRGAFTEADGTREERLARTRNSALEFGRVYLPHYFENEGAPFHEALDRLLTGRYDSDDLTRWAEEYGIEAHAGDPILRLMAVEIARGHAKSVIVVLCDTLRRICHGLDPYIILVSDTFGQAGAQLEDIKDELSANQKIKADFADLKPERGLFREGVNKIALALRNLLEGRMPWREGQIITTNNVRVDAIGRGGKMRGRRHGAQRPTCAKLDDLDNDESVMSKEQRDKSWNWVMSAVIPALDPQRGELQLIGTTIHFDCTIARATRKTDGEGRRLFTSIKFAALRQVTEDEAGATEDTERPGTFWLSNWPARFTVLKLLAIRKLLSARVFGAEYLCRPADPDTQIFNPERFTYYAPDEIAGKSLRRVLYIDPSKGKKGHGRKKSDFSGFADCYVDPTTRITYLIDASRKRLSPIAAENEIVRWYSSALQQDPNAELWIEENSFGDLLGERFQNRLREVGIDKVVKTLLHTEEKAARLERWSIRIESKGFRFPIKWSQENRQPEWWTEMTDYPAAFDDTIDACESADSIGSRSVAAASSGKDPKGTTSRDRLKDAREVRWMARLLRGRRAA